MATSTAHRRLLQEYRALTNNPPEGITAGPVSEDDLLYWEALIQGPEGTPFEGGVFPAELKFPKDYPLAPPTMKFIGEVWHPNGSRELREQTLTICSISKWAGLHLDSTPPRRRPKPLRARLRALVANPECGEDLDFSDEHARGAE
ncbi:hypothetical protein V493_00604 [Pseudogymnoascus sp. VKM F-4281 (FW-2241)]|nr:hypothetical protein V493_00604 [Pseudogymnoascus sp. VKM F-4281 (FW-2241)]